MLQLSSPAPARTAQMDFLLALFKPLLEVQEAALLLGGVSQDLVRAHIDEGTFRAVDISSAGEAGINRSLRIYRYSVEMFLLAPKSPRFAVPVEKILPHSRPDLLDREIAATFSCTTRHIQNLGNDGLLPGPKVSLGSLNRCPRFTREGVIAFLTNREIRA